MVGLGLQGSRLLVRSRGVGVGCKRLASTDTLAANDGEQED